jgi:hypothetical protein
VASRASCGKVSSSITKLWYLAAVKGLSMESKGCVKSKAGLGVVAQTELRNSFVFLTKVLFCQY